MHRMRDEDLAGARLSVGTLGARRLRALRRHAGALAPRRAGGQRRQRLRHAATRGRRHRRCARWLARRSRCAAIGDLGRWFDAQSLDTAQRVADRLAQGHVRECHGDLHVDNLAIVGGALTAFDCLEFDRRPALDRHHERGGVSGDGSAGASAPRPGACLRQRLPRRQRRPRRACRCCAAIRCTERWCARAWRACAMPAAVHPRRRRSPAAISRWRNACRGNGIRACW